MLVMYVCVYDGCIAGAMISANQGFRVRISEELSRWRGATRHCKCAACAACAAHALHALHTID